MDANGTHRTTTETAAANLDWAADLGRRGFRTTRVTGTTIRLATPAAALNAAEWLRKGGYDATAVRTGGQWAVEAR